MEDTTSIYHKSRRWMKRHKRLSLQMGMTGFLCTCNFREMDCIKDAYRLLEWFSNENCDGDGDKKTDKRPAEETVNKDPEEEEDISDALSKEIEALKDKKSYDKKFQYADTGVKNVIFMRSAVPDPLALATKIVKHLDETKEAKSRFILRFIPVLVVCKADMDDIKAEANDLFDKYFVEEPKTFSIVFNRHYNTSMPRNQIIDALAALIADKHPGNKADLKNPAIAVVVEVVKGYCLLSIAPDYFKYRKYNLTEICAVKPEPGDEAKVKAQDEPLGDEKSDAKEEGADSGGPE